MQERESQCSQLYKVFGKEPQEHITNMRGERISSNGSQVRKVHHRLRGFQGWPGQLFEYSGIQYSLLPEWICITADLLCAAPAQGL